MGKQNYSSIRSEPQHYMEASGELQAPAALLSGKNFVSHLIGGWMAPKDCVDSSGEETFSYP
jgi:hypothetical protein